MESNSSLQRQSAIFFSGRFPFAAGFGKQILTAGLLMALCGWATAASKPNIVLLYADDLGWTDLACQGSGYYETPNLDRLAQQSMVFTNAYAAAPNCAPSRASLMSGQYTPRHGVYTVGTSERGKSANRKLIPIANNETLASSCTTLAESLKKAGYQTCIAGKWHVTDDPAKDGFDTNFGGNHSGHPKSYFSPYHNPQLTDGPKGEHLPDRLSSEVSAWIEAHKEKPFFVYFPFYSVHTPLQAREDLTNKYEAKPKTEDHKNPKYAAMIEAMDAAVGKVLGTLDRLGLAENTVVVFTSDNGPAGQVSYASPLRGSKGMLYEGGIREPFFVRYPGVVKPGTINDTPINQIDLYPTFLKIAGAPAPKQPLDGVDLLPAFEGKPLPERSLFWHFPCYLEAKGNNKGSRYEHDWRTTPAGAVRQGDWKLIEYFEDGALELYNLEDDLSETTNLADQNPAKRDELLAALRNWRAEIHAPVPTEKNPEYSPSKKGGDKKKNKKGKKNKNKEAEESNSN